MTIKKRRIILLLCVLAFFVLMPAALLYSDGYRFKFDVGLYQTGGIYVTSPFSGADIYINNKEGGRTGFFQNGALLQNLVPGKYSVLVAKDGYWPWEKTLQVKERSVTKAVAMLIPKEPRGKVLMPQTENGGKNSSSKTKTEKEYLKIFEELNELSESNKVAGLTNVNYATSSDGTERLYWSKKDNKLMAEWLRDKESLPYFFCNDFGCSGKMQILGSLYEIESADFYPGRNDAIIVAVSNGIFAMEIDSRGGSRTLQPIYKGRKPISKIYEGDSGIYILDEGSLLKVSLD